jgi:opacity protein-like surface antigen
MRNAVQILAVLVLLAAPALAQTPDRGYVQGIGGIASASSTDRFFGGTCVLRAAGPVDGFVEIGRWRNGIWPALEDELSAAGDDIRRQIETQFGTSVPVSFDARVPITSGLAGARLRGPTVGVLGTYVEAGAGLARLRPEVDLEVNGESLNEEAGRLLQLDDERTELLTAAGAGVSVRLLRRIRLEGGYRFSRVHGDFAFSYHRMHLGVGYAF